jgi:hypothetical protein
LILLLALPVLAAEWLLVVTNEVSGTDWVYHDEVSVSDYVRICIIEGDPIYFDHSGSGYTSVSVGCLATTASHSPVAVRAVEASGVASYTIEIQVESTPTPEPTPTPSTNVYTGTVILAPGERRNVDFHVDCEEIETVTCSATGPAWSWGNGQRLGTCGEEEGGFYTRYPLSNTLTLLNREDVTNTVEIALYCRVYLGGASWEPIPPTPTLAPFPQLPTATGTITDPLSGAGIGDPFLGITFAQDYDQWLGYGQETINLINGGNVLFIVGAVGMAGLVLAWGIDQVKNPRSWR